MLQPKQIQPFVFIFVGLFSFFSHAQSVPSSLVYQQLLQLRETKRVLYVAAHPDDENTRLIAYLVNGAHAEVGYLSLTRGDGGQNLIGKELGVELGQIRTQELLKARETDGGHQYFTRAMDFGYSKNPSETLQNWDKQKVLADVVWAIRKFQPDIIITRFNTIPGVTHGHHTTSAILAGEAFDLSGDASAFPEQLQWVKPWQAKRIFFNAYNFGGEFVPEEGQKYHVFEVGGYNPLLGQTYHQIAADSRTMHKSQGFGATAGVGVAKDHIQLVKGEGYSQDAFDGVEDRWSSIKEGVKIRSAIDHLLGNFDFAQPENTVTGLLDVRASLSAVKTKEPWLQEKIEKLERIIFTALGLEYEFRVGKEFGFPGEDIHSELVINNPSDIGITVADFKVFDSLYPAIAGELKANQTRAVPVEFSIPGDAAYSQPYWLQYPLDGTLYDVQDQTMIGKPFNDPSISGIVSFTLGGQQFSLSVPLKYKYNDPVDGEVKQPFTIIPEVDLTVSKENVFLIEGADPKLTVSVHFNSQIKEGQLDFEGLELTQFKIVRMEEVESQKKRIYQVEFLPNGTGSKRITARYITSEGQSFSQSIKTISYKHIPHLTYFHKASLSLIQEDWDVSGAKVGYIPGAGDDVPGVLTALGYQVTFIGPEDYSLEYLKQFKAIVVGIRAYNTNGSLAANQQTLMSYVKAGGNMIVQYNTNAPLLTQQIGPFPFTIGRDRVAVQDSPMEADWSHPILTSPNKLSEQDLEGWVQERGLYFASVIDPSYHTPFTMQDPEEPSSKGSLIVGKYGEGTFVYTGISFFRQLPAGIPGPIKLFINLIEQ
jgi:LmbE family N-acetylglucosaminyl deacetylase